MKEESNTDKIFKIITEHSAEKAREMINKHIQDDEQSRQEFEEYLELWEKSADAGAFDKIDKEKDWLKVRSRIRLQGRQKPIPLRKYVLRIAAVLVLALGLAYLFSELVQTTNSTGTEYIETLARESNTVLNLPDGSKIYLNEGARVIYNQDYGAENRDIILEGEGFFEVARNESLPFKIHTLNSVVEVLGTSFNVKTAEEEVKVGVISGKVALYSQNNKKNRIELNPSDMGIFSAREEKLHQTSFDVNQILWHTHKLDVVDASLTEVCQLLADYYKLDFKPNNVSESYPGSIKHEEDLAGKTPEEVVGSLNLLLGNDTYLIARNNELIVYKN